MLLTLDRSANSRAVSRWSHETQNKFTSHFDFPDRGSPLAGPHAPLNVCQTPDGTIWSFGTPGYNDQSEPLPGNTLRHYDFQKGELGSYLARSTFPRRPSPGILSYIRLLLRRRRCLQHADPANHRDAVRRRRSAYIPGSFSSKTSPLWICSSRNHRKRLWLLLSWGYRRSLLSHS